MIVLVVAVGGGGWWTLSHRLHGVDAAAQQGRTAERASLTRADATAVSVWLRSGLAETAAVGRDLSPWSGAAAQQAGAPPIIDAALGGAAGLDHGALVLSGSGRVLAADSADAGLVGLDRPGPARPLTGLGEVEVATDPLEHTTDVDFLIPLAGSGGAVLEGRSRLPGALTSLLSGLTTPDGATLAVLDPAGDNLAGSGVPSLGLPLEPQYPLPMRDADAGRSGLVMVAGEGGSQLAASFGPAGWGWTVVLTQPWSSWTASSGAAWHAGGPLLAGLLVFSALVVLVLVLYLVRLAAGVDTAKRSFLTIAGHELRTPLTTIRGFSQLLTGAGGRLPASQREELIDSIGQQAQVLEHLVERLLAGARLETGVAPAVAREPLALNSRLERAVEHHRSLSPIHDIELSAEEDLRVLGDGDAIDQVLGHVLENAIKYSPAGGPIAVTARRQGRHVEVVVADQGVGLPASWGHQRRIFEVLSQSEKPEARVHDEGGIGMGLYITSQLLTRMGGSIRAVPHRPNGAEFHLRFIAAPTG